MTYVIAEIGVNHNGDLALAKEMVVAAKLAGAHCVKFQAFTIEMCESKDSVSPGYFANDPNVNDKIDYLSSVAFGHKEFKALKDFCEATCIDFLVTACDISVVSWLEDIGVQKYKIGSSDSTNHQLLEKIGRTKKPVIYSSGMCALSDVQAAVNVLRNAGCPQLTILQCTSQYPAPSDSLEISALSQLQTLCGSSDEIGFSDHSIGYEAALLALARGATVFEKHFTTDRNLPGVDQKASVIPSELRLYIDKITEAQLSLGSGIKAQGIEEMKNFNAMRKSFYLQRDMKSGETITDNDIVALRPATGILSDKYHQILGKKIKRDVQTGSALSWNDIE